MVIDYGEVGWLVGWLANKLDFINVELARNQCRRFFFRVLGFVRRELSSSGVGRTVLTGGRWPLATRTSERPTLRSLGFGASSKWTMPVMLTYSLSDPVTLAKPDFFNV